MIAVIAAASGRLLEPLIADYRQTRAVTVLSPLAAPSWLARAPGPLGDFARRRQAKGARLTPLLAVDAAIRAWARDRTDRRYLGEFALRTAIDAWAARQILRLQPETVVACSLAARRTFAAAKTIGARCVLVLDLPLFRVLHRDLDRAAEHWPHRTFLRRFRAPSWALARQEAERVLADLVLVRGAYARRICLDDGIPLPRIATLPTPQLALARPARRTGRIRLAGLAAARHGVDTALAAARMLGATLVVRTGEGTEPADLARSHGVATDDSPVDAIICPAICEAYAPELRATGVPVIASPMASIDGNGPDPYDPEAFAAAIARAW